MDESDKTTIINDDNWVECYICRYMFARKRETLRYCNTCKKGFCEGEHGTFSMGKFGYCVRCATNETFDKSK